MTERQLFLNQLQQVRAERRALLAELTSWVKELDSPELESTPTNYGIVGDVVRDIELLRQILRIDD